MRTATVLTHAEHEDSGRLGDLLRQQGFHLETLALHQGAKVPSRPPSDLLVVMGGPMGVYEADDPRYPFLGPEIALLQSCLAQRHPTIGICLGAQLLAAAAGSRVYPGTKEIGLGSVQCRSCGGLDLPTQATVLHWHGDTFDLPKGATLFASTDQVPNQAFVLERSLALQFHIEVPLERVPLWTQLDAHWIAKGPKTSAVLLSEMQSLGKSYLHDSGVFLRQVCRFLSVIVQV
jgi:GMP synthase (glutamine-hydrolysing)